MSFLTLALICVLPFALGQDSEKTSSRNREAGESSSRESRIDISPPKDDAKSHPYSKAAIADSDTDDNPEWDGEHA